MENAIASIIESRNGALHKPFAEQGLTNTDKYDHTIVTSIRALRGRNLFNDYGTAVLFNALLKPRLRVQETNNDVSGLDAVSWAADVWWNIVRDGNDPSAPDDFDQATQVAETLVGNLGLIVLDHPFTPADWANTGSMRSYMTRVAVAAIYKESRGPTPGQLLPLDYMQTSTEFLFHMNRAGYYTKFIEQVTRSVASPEPSSLLDSIGRLCNEAVQVAKDRELGELAKDMIDRLEEGLRPHLAPTLAGYAVANDLVEGARQSLADITRPPSLGLEA